MIKILIVSACFGVALGQLLTSAVYSPHAAPPAITTQSGNILRSYGNLGQVSTQTKTIDTPYSSVSKSDIRVSNPGYSAAYVSPAPVHEAPVFHHSVAVPAATTAYHAVPAASTAYHAAPAAIHGQPLLGVAFSAAPAVSHMSFDGYGIQYTY